MIRTPVAAMGCPKEIPDPWAFSRSSSASTPHSVSTLKTWQAKASLISMTSMSVSDSPVRSRTFWVAGTGPMPMNAGSHPAADQPTSQAMGSSPMLSTASSATTRQAAAASFCWEAFPAVTVPPGVIVRSLASTSAVESGRIPSSRPTISGSPLRWDTSIGTTSSSKWPASRAAVARRWLRAAKASEASLVMR